MILKFKWPALRISQSMNMKYAAIWHFLNMHERRRLDELPKSVYWSDQEKQLFYNGAAFTPTLDGLLMPFGCSALTPPRYSRVGGHASVWREHQSHLTLGSDLCRRARSVRLKGRGKANPLTLHQLRRTEQKPHRNNGPVGCTRTHHFISRCSGTWKAFYLQHWLQALRSICE